MQDQHELRCWTLGLVLFSPLSMVLMTRSDVHFHWHWPCDPRGLDVCRPSPRSRKRIRKSARPNASFCTKLVFHAHFLFLSLNYPEVWTHKISSLSLSLSLPCLWFCCVGSMKRREWDVSVCVVHRPYGLCSGLLNRTAGETETGPQERMTSSRVHTILMVPRLKDWRSKKLQPLFSCSRWE